MRTARCKCGLAVATAVVIFGFGSVARAQDDGPAVVPYRPSVASPADLPAPGWPELEAGVAWAKGGDTAKSFTSPVTFKLAWNESWAILIGTDAYDWQRADGSTAHSGGDTTLTLKYKLPVNDHLALGAEFGVALPTARPPIGSGGTDWGINTIASFDYPASMSTSMSPARIWAPSMRPRNPGRADGRSPHRTRSTSVSASPARCPAWCSGERRRRRKVSRR